MKKIGRILTFHGWHEHFNNFNWATNLSVLACSLILEKPIDVYNSLNVNGCWRLDKTLSVNQFNSLKNLGGCRNVGHSNFASNIPVRLFLNNSHYSALLPFHDDVGETCRPSYDDQLIW